MNRVGHQTATAPGSFSIAVAKCPKHYLATGGGSYAGAVDDVVSGPTSNGKGWMVDSFNTSTTATYHEASVVCAKGNKKLKLRKASADVAKARRDYLATHRH